MPDKEWNVQVKNDKDEWCNPIPSDGPDILSITGGIHKSVEQIDVRLQDGSCVRYTRSEENA